jgi:hypothetical protein
MAMQEELFVPQIIKIGSFNKFKKMVMQKKLSNFNHNDSVKFFMCDFNYLQVKNTCFLRNQYLEQSKIRSMQK